MEKPIVNIDSIAAYNGMYGLPVRHPLVTSRTFRRLAGVSPSVIRRAKEQN